MRREGLLAASLLLFSCTQHEGERCQQDKNCDGELICCKASGAGANTSGVCKHPSECTEADATTDTEEDTAPDVADVQGDEAGEDPDESADAPSEDAASEDAAVEETPPDATDGTDAEDMAEQR